MNTQPKALRLARELEACPTISYKTHAAELRRLHAECNDLAHQLNESNERNGRLKAQRDALLEALREAQACFITQDITRQEYERLYPDAVEETK